jgi:hypothetical protein
MTSLFGYNSTYSTKLESDTSKEDQDDDERVKEPRQPVETFSILI